MLSVDPQVGTAPRWFTADAKRQASENGMSTVAFAIAGALPPPPRHRRSSSSRNVPEDRQSQQDALGLHSQRETKEL